MLYKCANEACSTPFRKLREGKRFQVETELFAGHAPASSRRGRAGRRVEHFWLCDECSPYVTLTFDQKHGMIPVPLSNGTGQKTVTVLPMDELSDKAGNAGLLQGSVNEVRKRETLLEYGAISVASPGMTGRAGSSWWRTNGPID
jgi:hypothetical protein